MTLCQQKHPHSQLSGNLAAGSFQANITNSQFFGSLEKQRRGGRSGCQGNVGAAATCRREGGGVSAGVTCDEQTSGAR